MRGHNHITTVSSMTELLAVLVLLLVSLALIALIAAHFADRGVKPLRDAVSDFGAGERPWFYRLAAIWLGSAGLLLAVTLADAMFPKPTLVILMLLVFATARWAITLYPVDLDGAERTSTGRAHNVLAIAAFAAIAVAANNFVDAARPDQFWQSALGVLDALGWVVPLLAVACALTRVAVGRIFGLVERLFYAGMFAWFAAVALALLWGS